MVLKIFRNLWTLLYKFGIMCEMEKIGLQNGCCEARWSCANNNKKVCNVIPKKGENFVRCEHYKRKEKKC